MWLNALSQEWPEGLLYAFPPFPLIPHVQGRPGPLQGTVISPPVAKEALVSNAQLGSRSTLGPVS